MEAQKVVRELELSVVPSAVETALASREAKKEMAEMAEMAAPMADVVAKAVE